MKLADKVTLTRIILAPVFFVVYSLPDIIYELSPDHSSYLRNEIGFAWTVPVLWVIFIVAALTDMFDGMIARKRNEVSDFGKLFDPFADTLMQLTCLLCFVLDGYFNSFLFLIVLFREYGALFLRNLMLKKGISQGARMGGKIKTVAYIVACGIALLAESLYRLVLVENDAEIYVIFYTAANVVFVIAVILAIISFFDYYRIYRKSA